MMALLTWAFAFRTHQATSADGTTSQAPPRQQETLLFGLPVWQNDETSLEGQGRQQKYHKDGHTARSNFIGRPTGVHLTWSHRPAQGQTDTTTL